MSEKYRPLLVRLPPHVDQALRAWCFDNERPLSWAVAKSIESWLSPRRQGEQVELVCRAEDVASLLAGIAGIDVEAALSSLPASLDLFYATRRGEGR